MATPEEMRDHLRAFALSLPEAFEASPWGESVVKVRTKIFVFFGDDTEPPVGFGVKLPESHQEALARPGIEPAGYGLGKSGWVSVTLSSDEDSSQPDLYVEWVMESYRAVAPKKLSAQMDAAGPPAPSA